MDSNMEKDCVILEEFFQQIVLDMKVIVLAFHGIFYLASDIVRTCII